MSKNPLYDALADPGQLEKLYELDPKLFRSNLTEALESNPDVALLNFWKIRLEHGSGIDNRVSIKELLNLLPICVVAFLALRIPVSMSIQPEWYFPRFGPLVVFVSLIFYFLKKGHASKKITFGLSAGVLSVVLPMLFLPSDYESSSILMAIIHAPLVMWVLLGLSFTGDNWRSDGARLNFIRANGEVFIYLVLIGLGGGVLTAITLSLFELINFDVSLWYFNNVVLGGVVSAPIFATYVYIDYMKSNGRIASNLANIFTPLFLVTSVVYLIVMAMQQVSPFTNRDFLIVFNGLLLVVLGMTIFSICGRGDKSSFTLVDLVNFSLICLTLIINFTALLAILYRFSEWGLSPNRVVVLGANLLVFCHLSNLLITYWRFYKKELREHKLKLAAVNYFSAYGAWALFVVLVLPLVFNFE
jgi:hypothetical protein